MALGNAAARRVVAFGARRVHKLLPNPSSAFSLANRLPRRSPTNMADSAAAPAAAPAPASGKIALVTGTNSGVGLALTVALAEAGYTVWATMRTVSKADDLLVAATAAGVRDRVTVDECDVASDESVAASVERLLAAHGGRVDVLVNNAGYSVFGGVEFLDMATMKQQFETNFFGVIRCQQAVLPAMRAQGGGKIINISSVGGIWGQPFNDVYCASKFAVEGLAESQAALLREMGIYITNVEPGAIASSFRANVKRPDMTKIPPAYHPYLQSTVAAYGSSGKTAQTSEQVAAVVMERVVNVEHPTLRVNTNPAIQAIFDMQLRDPSGESGVLAAKARFLTPAKPAAE